MASEKLNQAVQLIKAGNKQAALPILKEIVKTEPDNETAWLWLYSSVDNIAQKKYCLQKVLEINPNNQNARNALTKLSTQSPVPAIQTVHPLSQQSNYQQEENKVSLLPTEQKKNTTGNRQLFSSYAETFRQQKLIGKVLMVCLSIFFLCCLCSIPILIFNPATPTPETELPSLIPTNTLSPIPTSTLQPTLTSQSTPDAYEVQISEKIPAYAEAFLDVNELAQQAVNDTSLLLDNDWKTKLGFTLGILNFRAEEMAKLEPSPKYVHLHSIIVKLADETYLFTDSYAEGIDNLDGDMIEEAGKHLITMTALMQEATTEMNNIKTTP